jgi:hypothetical protein
MQRFARSSRDNLRTTNRGLLIAAVIVAALFVILVVGHGGFDLEAVLPKRHP